MANPIDPSEEPVRLQTATTAVVAVVVAVVAGFGVDLPPEAAASLGAGVTAAANGLLARRTRAKVTPEANLPARVGPLGNPGGGPL